MVRQADTNTIPNLLMLTFNSLVIQLTFVMPERKQYGLVSLLMRLAKRANGSQIDHSVSCESVIFSLRSTMLINLNLNLNSVRCASGKNDNLLT